jgi:hypothetical protein
LLKHQIYNGSSLEPELIGNYKNSGAEWLKKGEPVQVLVHDFPDQDKGRIIPYGIYDLSQNAGWVNVGKGIYQSASRSRQTNRFSPQHFSRVLSLYYRAGDRRLVAPVIARIEG